MSQVALLAISRMIDVIASVSMSSVRARVRRITAPVRAPSSPAAAPAATICTKGSVTPAFAPRMPAAYAPSPKNALCPSVMMPA